MTRRRRGSGCLGRLALALVVLLAAYVAGLLVGSPVLTATRTTLLLADLVELPVRPLGLVSAEPRRETISYGAPADRLDLYLPAEAGSGDQRPAVILALGVHPQPIDSPDVTRVAAAIARIGVVVGVPDSSALRDLRIERDEPAHLADAVLAVAARPEVDAERVGLAGFSAGASIALIAAADPRIAPQLAYVSAFGGYADAETLLVDAASRSMVLNGETVGWAPDEGIVRDLRALLAHAAGPHFADRLFTAVDRPAAAAMLAELPDQVRRDLAAISPLSHVPEVMAPVYLLHGTTDSAIPVSHAHLLDAALGDQVRRLTVFGRFGHGQPGEVGLALDDAPDLWALLLHLHDIVAATTE